MAKIQKIAHGQEAEAKALISSIMQREFPGASQSYPADDLDAIRESYCSVGEAFFVALSDDDRVIGTAAVKRDDERTALLRRIFVDPNHRKQRLGYQLITRAIDFCKEVGYQEITFRTTTDMAAANKLCTDNGFQEKARIPVGETALIKYALFLKENSPLLK